MASSAVTPGKGRAAAVTEILLLATAFTSIASLTLRAQNLPPTAESAAVFQNTKANSRSAADTSVTRRLPAQKQREQPVRSSGGRNLGSAKAGKNGAVAVWPPAAMVTAAQTKQFTATVAGKNKTAVTWTASIGTVSPSGIYTAPESIATRTIDTVTATSAADPTKTATATVILKPGWSVSGEVTPALTDSGTNDSTNVAATESTGSITGMVNGAPVALTLSGPIAASTVTDDSGQYAFTGLGKGSYVVTPSQPGYIFTPSTILVDLTDAPVSSVEFTARPEPASVELSWSASESLEVVGYNLYRATATGGPYLKINSSLIASGTYFDFDVSRGRTYFYVATAVDSNGNESSYSTEATAVIPPS